MNKSEVRRKEFWVVVSEKVKDLTFCYVNNMNF